MSSSMAVEIGSTIQAASINKHPSVKHDLNPSTAASQKQPVRLTSGSGDSDVDEDEVPLSVLRPIPRRNNLPPLPDLRFEQSYLRSIEKAETPLAVAWITFRDQVAFPLLQGTVWELVLCGWRFWGGATQVSGNTVGAKIRRAGISVRTWLINNGFVKKQ